MSKKSVGRIRMESFREKFSCWWTIDNFSKICTEVSGYRPYRSYDSDYFQPLNEKMGRNWNFVACPELEVTDRNKQRAHVDVYLHVRDMCSNARTFRCTFHLVDSDMDPIAVDPPIPLSRDHRIGVRFRFGSSWPIALPEDALKVLVKVSCEFDTRDACENSNATPSVCMNASRKRTYERGLGSNHPSSGASTSRDGMCMDFEFIEPDVMTSLLKVINSDREDGFGVEVFLKLLEASGSYEMPDLKRYCADYLAARIDAKNVARLVIAGDRFEATDLKERALRYFTENFYSINLDDHRTELEQKPAVALDIMKALQGKNNAGKRAQGSCYRPFKRAS